MLLSLIRMIQAFRDYQRNVSELSSSAIANSPISASIVRTSAHCRWNLHQLISVGHLTNG